MIQEIFICAMIGACAWLLAGEGFAPHETRWWHPVLFGAIVAVLCLVAAVIARAEPTPREHHSNPALLDWIPAVCCVTNDCCWEVQASELKSLPDDEWEVKSTGQVRRRTAWSPDGKYYRCACDYDNTNKTWVRHQGANTRCIFPPMQMF